MMNFSGGAALSGPVMCVVGEHQGTHTLVERDVNAIRQGVADILAGAH